MQRRVVSQTLQKLAESPIIFSPADNCFVIPEVGRKRGLTKILSSIMPVPHGELDPNEPMPKRARRSKNDPVPAPRVWKPTGPEMRRNAAKAAHTCKDATSKCSLQQFGEQEGRSGIGRAYNTRHGSLVDEQLKLRVIHGRSVLVNRELDAMKGGLDPCTATLLDFLESRKQRIVAAQVPLYSAEMDVATAFDIMVDDGTVYEVKSTTVTTPEGIKRGDKSYETPRARLTKTALRGTPCSQFCLGQLQLYVTCSIIEEVTGFRPPSAAVLRVSPGVVRQYNLDPWFKSRAERFRRAIAQRTGQHKRNLRKKRHTQRLEPVKK